MALNIQITKSAVKSLKRLDKQTRERIKDGIYKLPSGDIKKLQGYDNYYRLRVGDYRIIYKSDGNTIIISDILPRGAAYKRY